MSARRISLIALVALAACGPARPEDAPAADRVAANSVASDANADTATAAIGCRRVTPRTPVPDTVYTEDLRGGVRFSCTLRPGQPPVDAFLDADTGGWPTALRITFPPGSPRPTQVMAFTGEEGPPPRESPILEAVDYDADGWGDLRTPRMWGHTGNLAYHVWIYDPARREFVRNAVLSDSTMNPEPIPGRPACVRTWSTGGGGIHGRSIVCADGGGAWKEMEVEAQYPVDGEPRRLLRDFLQRHGDTLILVRRDTIIMGD